MEAALAANGTRISGISGTKTNKQQDGTKTTDNTQDCKELAVLTSKQAYITDIRVSDNIHMSCHA